MRKKNTLAPWSFNYLPANKDKIPEQTKEPPVKQVLITQYSGCFKGIRKFQRKNHITADLSVPPVIHPPRRMHANQPMVKNGIITKPEQGEPTPRVNSLVYRGNQTGRLRLCLDPKDLNAAIQNTMLPLL